MANGWRTPGTYKLTPVEIEIVKNEIMEIRADVSIFVFNDIGHSNTCYNPIDDIVYICGDVLPDLTYASNNTRDLMSIRAVIAHEYYGHRMFREEYLQDMENNVISTPSWQDEFRASYTAAKICPNLSHMDQYHLIQDAIDRCREANQVIENDDFMKEVLYGYNDSNKYFSRDKERYNQYAEDGYER
ncbi:MAG: hypothetical protein NC428_07700 [Clostridium sp.]|nr:hypothetical protein [Clostridium sp.]